MPGTSMQHYYRYTYNGSPRNLATHGQVRKGDELILAEDEHMYQRRNPTKDFSYAGKEATADEYQSAIYARRNRTNAERAEADKKNGVRVNVPVPPRKDRGAGKDPPASPDGKTAEEIEAMSPAQRREREKNIVKKELDRDYSTRDALLTRAKDLDCKISGNPSRAEIIEKLAEFLMDGVGDDTPEAETSEAAASGA